MVAFFEKLVKIWLCDDSGECCGKHKKTASVPIGTLLTSAQQHRRLTEQSHLVELQGGLFNCQKYKI